MRSTRLAAFYVLHEKDDHTLMVLAACVKPGSVTPVHDHGTWAVVTGVDGEEKMRSISAPTMHLSQTMARFNYAAISLSNKAT